jgi:diguanylate cyclase (GGDEF)-like protein
VPLAKPHSAQPEGRTVSMLILAAVGACISILAVTWFHTGATRRLNESQDLVQHSQTINFALQADLQRVDRIESSLRMYQLTQEYENLHSAQMNTSSLAAGAVNLRNLVADDPQQSQRAQDLSNEIAALSNTVAALNPQSAIPSEEILHCRETLSLLHATESHLLSERLKDLGQNASRNDLFTIGFAAFSLVIVVALFGFILRDAVRRHRYERDLFDANEKLATTIRALERQAREANLVKAAREELQLCTGLEQTQQCAARAFEQLLPATSGVLCLISNSRLAVELVANWNGSPAFSDSFALDACCGLRSGHTRWRKPGYSEVHCAHFRGTPPEFYACIPLAAHGETLGMVYIECPSPGVAAMVEAYQEPLDSMVELISMSIAGLNLRNRLEQQSIRDSLTDLFNRHFMEIALERELSRAARQQKPLAVLMLDVDHFKHFNDTYGHEAGDFVLREVAETLRETVRNEDIVCRYGGEEFVVILPEVGLEAAMERAEDLRRMVSQIRMHYRGEDLKEVRVSIGVAIYPEHAESMGQILRAADSALYQAKHSGRNCVTLALPAETQNYSPSIVRAG